MKIISTIALLFTCFIGSSQIEFSEGSFDNGFTYPILTYKTDSNRFIRANNEIYLGLKDLEASVYCIGDYGYVQKGSHIQVQVMCNCMEMEQSELRFFFFNIDTGAPVKYSNLFDEKSRLEAKEHIKEKIKAHIETTNESCATALKEIDDLDIDKLDSRITRDGIEIRLPESDFCDASPVKIAWSSVKDYLKYNFL